MEIMGDTIVLNKPVEYVSGQEEHRHMSAVRLLNRGNMHLVGDNFDSEAQRALRNGDALHFNWWKYGGYNFRSSSIPRRTHETLDEGALREKRNDGRDVNKTLSGYTPASRLDIDSTVDGGDAVHTRPHCGV
jgi:hypothetical protein